jgi:hypothetical protein
MININDHAAKATKEQLDEKSTSKKTFWDTVYKEFVSIAPNDEYDNNAFEFDEVEPGRFHTKLISIDPGAAKRNVKDSSILYKWWNELRQCWSVARNNNTLSGKHDLFWRFCNGSVDVYYLQCWMKERNMDNVQLVDNYLPKPSDSLQKAMNKHKAESNTSDVGTKVKRQSKKQKMEAQQQEALDKDTLERRNQSD